MGTIGFLGFLIAMPKLDISEITSIYYCSPIASMLMGRLILGELLVKWDILACIFSLAGMLMVIKPPIIFNLLPWTDGTATISLEKTIGMLCMGVCLTTYSLSMLIMRSTSHLKLPVFNMVHLYGVANCCLGGVLILIIAP